jgi:hypothetical protein
MWCSFCYFGCKYCLWRSWTGGLGTFIPDRNAPNAVYTLAPLESGTVFLLRWNLPDPDGPEPCPSYSAVTTIISRTPVAANAGPDQVTCGALNSYSCC